MNRVYLERRKKSLRFNYLVSILYFYVLEFMIEASELICQQSGIIQLKGI